MSASRFAGASFAVTPSNTPRSIPIPLLPSIALCRIVTPLLPGSTTTPGPVFPRIRLPAAPLVPPISVFAACTITPRAPFGNDVVPSNPTPIQLPCTTAAAPGTYTPDNWLPEITFRAPAPVPPIVDAFCTWIPP